jgi:sporulation protein YlmC with PRC-barrel domain
MVFSIDEISIIAMYAKDGVPDRAKLLGTLKDIEPDIEEPAIQKVVSSVIRKVTAMSSEAVAKIDLPENLLG